ncbi:MULTISPECIES: hypothetical protein [Sphaerochaeta]|jgi:hypothetical protein|uniref:Tetratricopeptide repeat protein n=1 Tax=Sphaerochaeta associata TaxID=1129264 RepID=A0ABY4DDG3_9SPIR|nr:MULTISPECIES: hypothetical protein [Sphaerochaeta]MDT3359705.1 hypothetical protein [Spirochaetota bacterium]MDD3422959.1 hypothetical protein [Sphaerochaeta sp.]MDD3455816.1 hypothetical protein [Sphaerochaeta sp.]MEA5029912.1 hypothetical protein [Sphaerochaeta associata]UOM49986.1 hypothetical protein MUG09_10510 [Sphaerochaeta associata]
MRVLSKVLIVASMVIFFTSCATSITVRHLVPGEVDLSASRNIAVASTNAYKFPYGRPLSPWIQGLSETDFTLSSGYDTNLASSVASTASRMILDSVQGTGYFTVLTPEVTDAYMTLSKVGENTSAMLKSKGMQALLSSSISYMDVEEQVVGRDVKTFVTEDVDPNPNDAIVNIKSYEKVTSREYFLVQKATLTLTYTIFDLGSGSILFSRSFTGKEDQETKIGIRTYDAGAPGGYRDERRYSSGYAPSFKPLFEKIIRSFSSTISKQLAPSWQTKRLTLMSNKPKLEAAKGAYTLAERGSYEAAYRQFLSLYEGNGHIASGYNAALLLEAMGRFTEAVDLMNDVYNRSGSRQAYTALLSMQEAKSQSEKAQRQISGESTLDGQGVMMMQYVVME